MIRFLKYRLSIHLHISLIAGMVLSMHGRAAALPPLYADMPHGDHPKALISSGALDFFISDGHPTSEGITIRSSFKPKSDVSLNSAAGIEGNDIIDKEELTPGQSVAGYIKGYSTHAANYHFTVEDTKTKVGIEQSSDSPVSRFYLWSIHTTVSPEAYIHLDVAPDKTSHWKIQYQVFAPAAQS